MNKKSVFLLAVLVTLTCPLFANDTYDFGDSDSGDQLDHFEDFQVKIKPGSDIPVVQVFSDDPSKIRYNKSQGVLLPYEIEVRGKCPSVFGKLTAFRIEFNSDGINKTVLDIPVSGENRSLTGNKGNQWDTHTVNAAFQHNEPQLIDACVTMASNLVQTQSHDEVFGEGFNTGLVASSDKEFEVYYHCEGGIGFHDFSYDTARLPMKASCEPTGYESTLWLTESDLTLNPITNHAGACEANISGVFHTSYELYSLRSDNSTATFNYRFGYENGNHTSYSEWWEKTAHPTNGGAVAFNYTDRLPGDISNGKVWIDVDFEGYISSSDKTSFSIDCEDALPVQQVQTLDLEFSVEADRSETVAVNGQLCPSHALLVGNVDAGYPINGSTLIVGQSLADLYVNAFSASAGDQVVHQKRVPLEWAGSNTTNLTLNNQTASDEQLSQTLSYGFRVRNSNNDVVESLAKDNYELFCELPSVNPGIAGSGTLGMLPDHTGGGAPTDLADTQRDVPTQPVQAIDGSNLVLKRGIPANTSDRRTDVVGEAGLRSDGELVQAKKPQDLLSHELTHTTQQQGRMLVDSDVNEATSEKPPTPAGPAPGVPVPYPNISRTSDSGESEYQPKLENVYVSSYSANGSDSAAGAADSHDRLANIETSHQQEQRNSVPLENAAVSSLRTEQLSNKTTLLADQKIGDRCSARNFPENAVIEQARQQVAVECLGNKIQIKKTSTRN